MVNGRSRNARPSPVAATPYGGSDPILSNAAGRTKVSSLDATTKKTDQNRLYLRTRLQRALVVLLADKVEHRCIKTQGKRQHSIHRYHQLSWYRFLDETGSGVRFKAHPDSRL